MTPAQVYAEVDSRIDGDARGGDCPGCKMPARMAQAVPGRDRVGGREESGELIRVYTRAYRCHWCEGVFLIRLTVPESFFSGVL